jgi:hypothetical protein
VEAILSGPVRSTLNTLKTPISLLGFPSGAAANFTAPFFLDHTSNDVSEN